MVRATLYLHTFWHIGHINPGCRICSAQRGSFKARCGAFTVALVTARSGTCISCSLYVGSIESDCGTFTVALVVARSIACTSAHTGSFEPGWGTFPVALFP